MKTLYAGLSQVIQNQCLHHLSIVIPINKILFYVTNKIIIWKHKIVKYNFQNFLLIFFIPALNFYIFFVFRGFHQLLISLFKKFNVNNGRKFFFHYY